MDGGGSRVCRVWLELKTVLLKSWSSDDDDDDDDDVVNFSSNFPTL